MMSSFRVCRQSQSGAMHIGRYASIRNHGMFISELLLVLGLAGSFGFAILLAGVDEARRSDRQSQNNTKLRGIHQSQFVYAQSNGEYFPGLTARGHIRDDGAPGSMYDPTLNGASVEHRFAILLDDDAFEGRYAVSPFEEKTPWSDDQDPVSQANYSYAQLRIHSDAQSVGEDLDARTRPDQGRRSSVWRSDLDAETVLMSDRVKVDGSGGLYSIQSVAPNDGTDDWRGSVVWADNHAAFEENHELDTKYGRAPAIQNDHLFRSDQGDATLDDDEAWDEAMDKANAVLDAVGSSAGVEATRMTNE